MIDVEREARSLLGRAGFGVDEVASARDIAHGYLKKCSIRRLPAWKMSGTEGCLARTMAITRSA